MIGDPTATYVAFDLEATGLSAAADRIIEVGAVRFGGDGRVLAEYERLVNPLRPSGDAARRVHGIADEELGRARPAPEVLPGFVDFLGDPAATTLLAHNAAFDAGLLGAELARAGLPLPAHAVIDTLAWSRRRWPGPGGHRLDALARRAGDVEAVAHRALADARRVRAVFLALQEGWSTADDRAPLAYPIYDGAGPPPVPRGWEAVAAAIDAGAGAVVRIEYEGGTRGPAPRDVTPIRFAVRGGQAYLVAYCHLGGRDKEYVLDRCRSWHVVAATAAAPATGARPA